MGRWSLRCPNLWLALAFLVPNLGALGCGFVFDDVVLIVENEALHGLNALAQVWTHGYWPDRGGLVLYRPVVQGVWAILWVAGDGSPLPFHLLNLALGLSCVLLLHGLARRWFEPGTAFAAAFLFALLPIHTEATTSVVGSSELLAATFALASLTLFAGAVDDAQRWGATRRIGALLLFALALLSKESAAAFLGIAALLGLSRRTPRELLSRFWPDALGASLALVAVIAAREFVAVAGEPGVPVLDNPAYSLDPLRRVLSALWVQVLYLSKTIAPITLSADYSYDQIPVVRGLADPRAWLGGALVTGAVFAAALSRAWRPGVLIWATLLLPTSNLLFPIGTIMGERLAFAPSAGVALIAASLGRRYLRGRAALALLAVAALVYGARTLVRNLDWVDGRAFNSALVESSPRSARAQFGFGTQLAADARDLEAVAAYDRALAILPAYPAALHNRGNALARLGRNEEAMASYRACLEYQPGHYGARYNLQRLEQGLPANPPRRMN